MEHKGIVAASIVLVFIILGMFCFAYLKTNEIQEGPQETPVVEDTTSPYGYITRIDAKHFFVDGTHTIAGQINMPTPCDLLNWNTRVMEMAPEQVVVDFTVVNHAESCTQVITPQRFKVSFQASENASITATLMDRKVELNIVPAGEGETPDDFELFIKG